MRRMLVALCLIACLSGVAVSQKVSLSNRVWVGIGYLYARNGGTAGGGALLGTVGVFHAAFQGAVWGAAAGGPAGAAAGIAVGL